jgi:cyanophycinase
MTISGSKGSIQSVLVAMGGGELAEATDVLSEIFSYLEKRPDPRVVVMTVATSEDQNAASKFGKIFRKRDVRHVEMVHVNQREDAFNKAAADKLRAADVIYFTGGDQLNVTALLGGSPLDEVLHERLDSGVMIAGSSAGAAMMSSSMIISGTSDAAPRVGAVEIAPGMGLVEGVMIDTHFSQRGRHGRLLAAVAHYPQVLGLGLDEKTAVVIQDGHFKVVGEGVVTVVDASQMKYSDLAYQERGETVGMFDVAVHVLPGNYSFNLKKREPKAREFEEFAGSASAGGE